MTAAQRRNVPPDKVNLRLILVSGNRADFLVSPGDSVTSVVRQVFENWPKEWSVESKVSVPDSLRLIYLGRFLKGSLTLSALNLPLGKTTVMHLVVREHIPEEGSAHGSSERSKDRPQGNSCDCCVIL